jgi:hypothetical protein
VAKRNSNSNKHNGPLLMLLKFQTNLFQSPVDLPPEGEAELPNPHEMSLGITMWAEIDNQSI